jgi:hypothetical protein
VLSFDVEAAQAQENRRAKRKVLFLAVRYHTQSHTVAYNNSDEFFLLISFVIGANNNEGRLFFARPHGRGKCAFRLQRSRGHHQGNHIK